MSVSTSDSDWLKKIPPLKWCEYQLLKKIEYSLMGLNPYQLGKYATTLDECSEYYDNKIRKLVRMWKSYGLITLEPAYQGARTHVTKITEKGKEFLKKFDNWYGTPTT